MEYNVSSLGCTKIKRRWVSLHDWQSGGELGLAAASAFWGMSTFNYYEYPIFVTNEDINTLQIRSIPRLLNGVTSDRLPDGVVVTDKITTVCDVVEYDDRCDTFVVYETVDDIYHFGTDEEIAAVEQQAKERGIYEKLIAIRDQADEDFNSVT